MRAPLFGVVLCVGVTSCVFANRGAGCVRAGQADNGGLRLSIVP